MTAGKHGPPRSRSRSEALGEQDLPWLGKLEARRWLVDPWEHDKPAEQAPVDVLTDVLPMFMERPGALHAFFDVEDVGPRVARADLVRTATITALRAEGPRAVGVRAVAQPVHVQAVRRRVAVEHVDVQALSRVGVQHGPRDTAMESRLVDIGVDDLVRDRHEVGGVVILPVHDRLESAGVGLTDRHVPVLVSVVVHAVAPILDRRHRVRVDRAVAGHLLDLEIDVSVGHLRPPSRLEEAVRFSRASKCRPRGRRPPLGQRERGRRPPRG